MIHCQRCPAEDGVFAEFKVRMTNSDTGKIIRFWYVCAVHLEMDFGPWLKRRTR